MHHGLAQVFGAGFASPVALRDGTGGAVILDHGWVGDGDVSCALLKVGHGIAASGHDSIDERIGLVDGHSGIVDEPALHRGPFFGKALPRSRGERLDFEAVDALLAVEELGFGLRWVPSRLEGAIVLRTELLPEPAAPALTSEDENYGSDGDDRDHNYDGDQGSLIHVDSILRVRCPAKVASCRLFGATSRACAGHTLH